MKRAAVIGRPIAHSLSPLIHNAWLAAAGIDGCYESREPADGEALGRLLDRRADEGWAGFNVTAPFKEAACAWAETAGAAVGDAARRARSVNLLVFDGEPPRAESTDGQGVVAALAEQAPGLDLAAGPAVVLGAGGAAAAAVVALKDAGVSEVRLVNRTEARARGLAERLGRGVSAWGLDRLSGALARCQLLINAATGLEAPDLSPMTDGGAVLDMTYRPLETPLLASARACGLTPVDGLAMLIGQARPSFEALFGQAPPDIDVRALCLKVMEGEP